MAKTKHSIAALDKQTSSLAQITNNAFALFFDDVSIKCHLLMQKGLHTIIYPPAGSKEAPRSLHLQCQSIKEPAKLARFKDDSVQRVAGTGATFVGFPRFQRYINDFGI